MGQYRPIKTICWENFLTFKKCAFNKTAKGSHHKWKCPNCFQSIIFRGAEKEIPFDHIITNLRTMGVPKEEFIKWIEDNC